MNHVPSESDLVRDELKKVALTHVKDMGLLFIEQINSSVPDGREASLAKTKIEEAVMWAVKALTA